MSGESVQLQAVRKRS